MISEIIRPVTGGILTSTEIIAFSSCNDDDIPVEITTDTGGENIISVEVTLIGKINYSFCIRNIDNKLYIVPGRIARPNPTYIQTPARYQVLDNNPIIRARFTPNAPLYFKNISLSFRLTAIERFELTVALLPDKSNDTLWLVNNMHNKKSLVFSSKVKLFSEFEYMLLMNTFKNLEKASKDCHVE